MILTAAALLQAQAMLVAKIVLDDLSSREGADNTTLAELRQMCRHATRKEFPALSGGAQGDVADRAQILFIRLWGRR